MNYLPLVFSVLLCLNSFLIREIAFPELFFFVIFTFFQHYLGHFLTLFQLYIITTNRPCEAVGVEEINGLVYEMPKGS